MKSLIFTPVFLLLLLSCTADEDGNTPSDLDFKHEMRDFVIGISEYSKNIHSGFLIIPQNGIELITNNGEEDGSLNTAYLNAIDGNGQEDLFYGYENDDEATPTEDNEYLKAFLNQSKNSGKVILVIDYCSTTSKMENSYNINHSAGYVSFAADHRELDNIPDFPDPIHGENSALITTFPEVKNFLYLINPENFDSKADFINAVTATNYDLLIMDLFFNNGTEFTASEIYELKNKANGGKRLVIAYLSIGEAEDYRYYWQSEWDANQPIWLDDENPDWEGNYKVKYWEHDWQSIIYGNENSYTKKILDADFDGVYLDIIDAFEYYE